MEVSISEYRWPTALSSVLAEENAALNCSFHCTITEFVAKCYGRGVTIVSGEIDICRGINAA